MVAVQFSIVTKKFESFRKPFVTNKYLSLIQWEEIMSNLNRALCKQLKLSEDDQLEAEGEFRIDDEALQVTYKAKPKDECYIDFNKLEFPYNLNWILAVAVSRPDRKLHKEPPAMSQKSPKTTSLSQKPTNGVSQTSTLSVPSEQEYDPSPETKELMSRYTPGKSEGLNRQFLGSPEYCPQNTDKSRPSSTYTASRIDRNGVDSEKAVGKSKIQKQLFGSSDEDNSPIVVLSQESDQESPVVRPKKRGLLEMIPEKPEAKTRSHKKVTIGGWLSRDKHVADRKIPKGSSRGSKAKSNKDSEPGTSSKKHKTTKENKDPVDPFDDEKLEQINDFVTSSKIRIEQRKERKEELKDYKIKDCTDLSNADLKR